MLTKKIVLICSIFILIFSVGSVSAGTLKVSQENPLGICGEWRVYDLTNNQETIDSGHQYACHTSGSTTISDSHKLHEIEIVYSWSAAIINNGRSSNQFIVKVTVYNGGDIDLHYPIKYHGIAPVGYKGYVYGTYTSMPSNGKKIQYYVNQDEAKDNNIRGFIFEDQHNQEVG